MSERLPPVSGEEEDFPEPPRLKALRRMTTALMAVLTVGFVTVAGAMVWRLVLETDAPEDLARAPSAAPAEVVLPAGEAVLATGGDARSLILATRDADGAEWLVYFDRATGEETARTRVDRRAR